ncbi:MAG: hypothetical protein ACYC96_06685 [Fimbriimonadaceae bacterium]
MRVSTKSLTAIAMAWAATFASAQNYRIIDLSPGSPFNGTLAYGISSNGLITGTGIDPVTAEYHAFILQNGVYQDLGDFGYPYGADGDAINNAGQLAATGYGPGYNALIYSNGVATPVGTIDGGYSVGLSINSSGNIVGRAVNGDGGNQGFSYINGNFTALSVDIARSINDLNQFVGSIGYYWSYGGYIHGVEHAFVNTAGVVTDLGDLGGGPRSNTEAYGINNLGQITGYSTAADGTLHAFLYSGGVMSDLGTFAPYYTRGISINDAGEVLGTIETYVGGPVGYFLYSNGVLHNFTDLLDSSAAPWTQLTMTQINNSGYVVGYGAVNGNTDAFLAQPYDVELPASYSIYRGIYLGGTLSSLFSVDGDYLKVQTGPTLTSSEAPVSVIVNGTSTISAPADLRLSLTAHVNTPGLTQTVELWDYVASAWVVVGTQAATTTDNTEVAVASNPARFVKAGTNAVSARISWKRTGPTLLYRWSASIDQAVWNDSP